MSAQVALDKISLQRAAHAENTRIVYDRAWQSFVGWCTHPGISIDPTAATPDDIVRWIISLATTGTPQRGRPVALNTIRTWRQGLTDRFRREHVDPVPSAAKIVDDCLRGLARIRPESPRQARAIREDQLVAMLATCGDRPHGLRDAAVLSLGFAAALRRSELVGLRVADLVAQSGSGPGAMIVHIRKSKTDQEGAGQKIPVIDGESIRPVQTVRIWLDAVGIRHDAEHVFQSLGSGGKPTGRPIDDGEVSRVVKRRVKIIGLDPSGYSGHSLRAGFVTSAIAHHARIDKIMEITRHKSPSMLMHYARDEDVFTDHAGAAFL